MIGDEDEEEESTVGPSESTLAPPINAIFIPPATEPAAVNVDDEDEEEEEEEEEEEVAMIDERL